MPVSMDSMCAVEEDAEAVDGQSGTVLSSS